MREGIRKPVDARLLLSHNVELWAWEQFVTSIWID